MQKKTEIVLTILVYYFMEKLEAKTVNSVVNVINIQRDTMPSIINKTTYSESVIHCSVVCSDAASPSFYYNTDNNTCHCNLALDTGVGEDNTKPVIMYGVLRPAMYVTEVNGYIKHEINPARQDCLSLYNEGFTTDGVYNIQPVGGTTVYTWCDMSGGGWTVFQRRMNGEEDFNRNWTAYKFGFGNPSREFWLGLESIHRLTQTPVSELSIELETFGDTTPISSSSTYASFKVTNETHKYRLSIDGFSGDNCEHLTSGNEDFNSNNMAFSTNDVDNDLKPIPENCAVKYQGGWWYSWCFAANFNGVYRQEGRTFPSPVGIVSYFCWGPSYSLKTTVMKQRSYSSY